MGRLPNKPTKIWAGVKATVERHIKLFCGGYARR